MRKTFTVFVCSLLLASIFSITHISENVTAGSPPPPDDGIDGLQYIDGDWKVNTTESYTNETIVLTGNLTIEFGGNLTFKNVTLMMNSTTDGEFHIEVLNGGTFYIYDYDNDNVTTGDASNITAYNTNFEYLFWVREGSNFTMKNSELHECGYDWNPYDESGLYIEADNVLIEHSIISDGYFGIVSWYANNTIISNCTIENNLGIGSMGIFYYHSNGYILSNLIRNQNGIGAQGLDISYSSVIINQNRITDNPIGMTISVWSNATVSNNSIVNNNNGLNIQDADKVIVENNNFSFNTEDAIYILGEVGRPGRPTIINNTLFDNDKGIVCGSRGEPTIINTTIMATWTDDLEAFGESHITTINTTFNKSRVAFNPDTSNLTVNWYLHTFVKDSSGIPIPGATVQIQDNTNGTFDKNYTTDANGYLNWTVLREYYQTQNTLTDYSSHNLTISKPGYLTAYAEIEMNESRYITVTLQADDEPPELNHTSITSAPINEPIEITVNVTDIMGVSNVTLYYENVGDTTYTPIDMNLTSGNNQSGDWIATIPAQSETGLAHYFIWANDTSGNNITTPIIGDYTIQITGPPSIEITNPIGGEDRTGGSSHQIAFIVSDTEDAPANLTVFLNYSYNAGTIEGTIGNTTGDGSPESWSLPFLNATDVVVNATVIDSDGNKHYDDSAIFEIDSTPPEISSTNPANNTTGISIFQPVVIQFNEKMNVSSVIVNQTNGTDPGGWSWFWNNDKDTITGIHDAWLRGENVEITVQTGYKDDSNPGNANNTDYIFSFTTETNPSPEIVHANISGPQELGDEIRINATITDDGSVMNAVLWWQDVDDNWHENYMQKDGDVWEYPIPSQLREGKVKYQINATDDLQQKNTTIIYEFYIEDMTSPTLSHTSIGSVFVGESINITCEVTDLGGVDVVYLYYKNESATSFTQVTMNPGYWYELPAESEATTIDYYFEHLDIYFNPAITIQFSVDVLDITQPDTTPPEVLLATPTGDNIPTSTSISIVFNEAVNQTSVEDAISISPTISDISYYWLYNQTLVIDISGNLSYNTTYTVTINTGAKDLTGNSLVNDYSWQFTTAEEPEIVQPPASNDWGWVGIIILLIAIIMLMLFYQFNRERKKEEHEEPIERQE